MSGSKLKECVSTESHLKRNYETTSAGDIAKKRKKHSSSESEDSESSSSSSSSSTSSLSSSDNRKKKSKKSRKKQRKKERKLKHKQKIKKKKLKAKLKKKEKEKLKLKVKKETDDSIVGPIPLPDAQEIPERSRLMAPMTKEEWEKRQSVVRKVYDEATGRHRLIKGDGEVIEEIVSKQRHCEINRQATQGDGASFQNALASKLGRQGFNNKTT